MEIKKKKVGARGRGREKRENRDGQIQKETDRQKADIEMNWNNLRK